MNFTVTLFVNRQWFLISELSVVLLHAVSVLFIIFTVINNQKRITACKWIVTDNFQNQWKRNRHGKEVLRGTGRRDPQDKWGGPLQAGRDPGHEQKGTGHRHSFEKTLQMVNKISTGTVQGPAGEIFFGKTIPACRPLLLRAALRRESAGGGY